MARAFRRDRTPVDDFLDWERLQEERYEYLDGFVYMMVGGTLDHNTICLNIASTLRALLGSGPCRAFMEGVKVRAEAHVFYPDVLVACGDLPGKADITEEPVVVIEVLSPSTKDLDHGRKWEGYRRIASLRHYVLVSQDDPVVELFTREGEGWRYLELRGLDRVLRLDHPVAAEIPLATIYERTSAAAD